MQKINQIILISSIVSCFAIQAESASVIAEKLSNLITQCNAANPNADTHTFSTCMLEELYPASRNSALEKINDEIKKQSSELKNLEQKLDDTTCTQERDRIENTIKVGIDSLGNARMVRESILEFSDELYEEQRREILSTPERALHNYLTEKIFYLVGLLAFIKEEHEREAYPTEQFNKESVIFRTLATQLVDVMHNLSQQPRSERSNE